MIMYDMIEYFKSIQDIVNELCDKSYNDDAKNYESKSLK